MNLRDLYHVTANIWVCDEEQSALVSTQRSRYCEQRTVEISSLFLESFETKEIRRRTFRQCCILDSTKNIQFIFLFLLLWLFLIISTFLLNSLLLCLLRTSHASLRNEREREKRRKENSENIKKGETEKCAERKDRRRIKEKPLQVHYTRSKLESPCRFLEQQEFISRKTRWEDSHEWWIKTTDKDAVTSRFEPGATC